MQRVLAARLVLAGALADKLELIEVAHWLRQSLMAVVLAEVEEMKTGVCHIWIHQLGYSAIGRLASSAERART